jgi:hypothetical protein
MVNRYVVDIPCRGRVIGLDILAGSFGGDDHETDRVPKDGQVDRTFEQLKVERLKHFRRDLLFNSR